MSSGECVLRCGFDPRLAGENIGWTMSCRLSLCNAAPDQQYEER